MRVGDVMAGAEVIVMDLKMEEGTTNQEMQTGKGKGTDLEPPEGMQPYGHLDFSLVRSKLDF